ncbi:MAG: helicase-exonuclease AddAB subunit AddB [Roseburia sp.]
MSLQFIFGNSGSGKSGYLYRSVLEQAAREPDRNFLILVPEQFTMQTQRELVCMQENHAIMNVDVLSFARLAYRVFDELGKQELVVLEETGKNLMLRKVAEQNKGKLRVLGANMNKMGCVDEVKSLISEMAQYNVSPDALEEFLQKEDLGETLRLKLTDIVTLYRGFEEYKRGRFITSEEILTLLSDVAQESAMLRDSVIVFDEFTGFTPIQNQLMYQLMRLAKEIVVSVTMDVREDFYHSEGIHELFAMSKKTVHTLLHIAEELSVPVKEPVVLSHGEQMRYREAPALFFMEQNLFRPKAKSYGKNTDEVQITGLKNPREELRYVAREITRLVRQKGYRYRDIAVVTGDVAQYANYVPDIFAQFDIPFFIDQTKNILFHPFIECTRAVLEVVEQDFSYESVFRFLRCGLVEHLLPEEPISQEEIDRLENYVLAKGIRGLRRFSVPWTMVMPDGTLEEYPRMNQIRERLKELFSPLFTVFREGNVEEQTYGLYRFMRELRMEEQLKRREELYQQEGNQALAKEYAQIYRIVMDLLDKMASLLGEEKISVREYSDILDAGFSAAKVGIIPPGNDKVTIGDIERTRLNHIRILFFVGVNDGVVPKSGNAGGIISQLERETMAAHKLELAPGARERVFIQKFYLYLNLTKPSERLYLTFSRVNSEGKALRRSYLIGTMCRLFPELAVTEVEEQDSDGDILTPKSSRQFFLEELQRVRQNERRTVCAESGNPSENERTDAPADAGAERRRLWFALARWYLDNPEYEQETRKLFGAAWKVHSDEPISRAVTRALYGTVLENSVTRLERFAACAYAHYLSYGLNLKERELQEFAGTDMGTIYHDALEHFAEQIEESEYTWFNLPEEVQEQWVKESMDYAVGRCRSEESFEDPKNRYLLERMRATVRRTVWALMVQVQKGRFVPKHFEVSFSAADHLDAIRFQLGEEERMQLQGRIDRIDLCETDDRVYVKIIDYKSGNTSFSLLNLYHGLQLQLVVYLNAALEVVAGQYPGKQAVPAGIFYYHVSDPMVETEGSESEAEIRHAVLEQLKLNGLVNEEPEIYRAMDSDFAGTSSVIPVALKADGSLKASSKTASTYDFQVMSDYVNHIIADTGRRILDGDVAVQPYLLDGKSGCDYCPYHMVCGFDERLAGYHYRRLDKTGDSEALLERMKTETERTEQ